VTIRGVCFDATGTLFEIAESVGTVYARAAAELGIRLPAWRLDDAFARVLRHGPGLAETSRAFASRAEREQAERAWWRDRVRQTFQAADSTVAFEDSRAFADGLFDHYGRATTWRERPGVRSLLGELQARGLRLGVASNFDHRLAKILEGLDLMHFFSAIEIPSLHARSKPERAVFTALAEALDCRIDELAYLGDDPPEVLAALTTHGLRVLDVRGLPTLAGLADAIVGDDPRTPRVESAGREAAKLAPPDDPPMKAARPAK
jgi:putative hydrolase of the HAD superfamily